MVRHVLKTKGAQQLHEHLERPWRIRLLAFLILVLGGLYVVRLYFLQVVEGEAYAQAAQDQHVMSKKLQAERGEIFLKEGEGMYPVAINQELQMAYAVPQEIQDLDSVAQEIAQILGLEQKEVREKFGEGKSMFKVLKHKLSQSEVDQIRERKLPGIHLSSENFRYYPANELAAQTVGFVGSNGTETRGMYGIESSFEKVLRGEAGQIEQEGDTSGRWISVADRKLTPSKNGADLLLTIDHSVQYEVEKILKASLEKFAADSGSVVVMEPQTGRILALANLPTFNPNDYSKVEDISLFASPAVSTAYESGSVFKPLTIAMGIDDGKISPNTTFVDPGVIVEAGYEIKNSEEKSYGLQTMTGVLENSINTGVIFVEKLLGNKKFADYTSSFGFGEKTGVQLPGEATGNTRNLENAKRTINFFTASFGQGITMTPVQLAVAYSALANGGKLMVPQIVEKIIHADGKTEEVKPQELRRVISPEAARQTGEILRSVVVNGHGKRADVPGYKVCGKTGTAEVAKQGGGGYEQGMNIGSFAGFAPLDEPRFVVIVKLYNPKNVEWAESSAAPTFGEVMDFLLRYYKIKPTEDPATSPKAKMAPLPILTPEQIQELQSKAQAEKTAKEKNN